jgi:mannitol-1-phosphate/altronate dehydrogenase
MVMVGCASVPEVPGVDLEWYQRNLLSRFSNPYVKDKASREGKGQGGTGGRALR